MFASRQQVLAPVVAVAVWPSPVPALWLSVRVEFGYFLAWLQVWLFAEKQAGREWDVEIQIQHRYSLR